MSDPPLEKSFKFATNIFPVNPARLKPLFIPTRRTDGNSIIFEYPFTRPPYPRVTFSRLPHLIQKGSVSFPQRINRNLSRMSVGSWLISHVSLSIFPSLSIYKPRSNPMPTFPKENSGRKENWLYIVPSIVAEPMLSPIPNDFPDGAFSNISSSGSDGSTEESSIGCSSISFISSSGSGAGSCSICFFSTFFGSSLISSFISSSRGGSSTSGSGSSGYSFGVAGA